MKYTERKKKNKTGIKINEKKEYKKLVIIAVVYVCTDEHAIILGSSCAVVTSIS